MTGIFDDKPKIHILRYAPFGCRSILIYKERPTTNWLKRIKAKWGAIENIVSEMEKLPIDSPAHDYRLRLMKIIEGDQSSKVSGSTPKVNQE